MNSVLLHLIIAQFKEFFREPAVLFWGFAFPILLAGVLGIAFVNQPQGLHRVALVESAESDWTIKDFQLLADTSNFLFHKLPMDSAKASVEKGEFSLLVELRGDKTVFYYDKTNDESESIYLQLSNLLLQQRAQQVRFETAGISNNGLRYIDFLIPGLIAMGIMNSCLWGIGWNLIDIRIKKLLRRMIATPMKKSTFLFAQIVSRGILVFIETMVIYLFALFIFEVQIEGSFLHFLLVFITGITAFSGLAILISSRAKHSQVGNGIINAVTLPLIILSGIFFSYQNFPEWAISIIKVLPLTILADGLREIFNQGAPFVDLLPEIGSLLLYGALFFTMGLKIYKWY